MPDRRHLFLLATGLWAAAVPAAAQLAAGAGRAEVALTPAMLPVDGFATVHDPLAVRVLVLADGRSRTAVAVLDQTSLGTDVVEAVKAIVARDTGTPAGDIVVVASHTFSAPHLFTVAHLPPGMTMSADDQRRAQAYYDAVLMAVETAARAAVANRRPARLNFGRGTSDVNVNRNVPMADGWWLGANPAGFSDKEAAVVRVDGVDGRPIAFLLDDAVQSAVLDHSTGLAGKPVSADLGGAAARHVEAQYGAVALFLTGAAGDQLPAYTARRNLYDKDGYFRTVDLSDAAYTLLDTQGERLGEDMVRAAAAAVPVTTSVPLRIVEGSVTLQGQERPRDLAQIRPSRSYPFRASGSTEAPFYVLQLGDLAIVGVQAELSAVTGRYLRDRSPFAHTMVVTMVNGAAKYMPEAESYRQITYEAMNSSYAAGSAERFADAILSKLRDLRGSAPHSAAAMDINGAARALSASSRPEKQEDHR